MDLGTLRALVTPAGAPLLDQATRHYVDEDEFALGSRLRREHPPDLVAAALTLARLRHRAAAKFDPDDAARMYFTVNGYEQATRARVARHRAARIAAYAPGARVLDLCCGIGADLVALARAGLEVTGVESDELTAEMARLNIDALELGNRAGVVTTDATTVDHTGYAAVTCDPARRTTRGRVFDPDAYAPPWSFVLELLSRDACVKVAPGIPHDRVPAGTEAEWVSENGDVKEAALWSGTLAGAGVHRRATLLRTSGASGDTATQSDTITDADDPGGAAVHPPGPYVYEPDGAVIRAGLVTAAARVVDGWMLDPTIAYLSGDTLVESPFVRSYEVLDILPYDVKRLRRYVREHGIGTLTIKKRGVDVTPEELRRSLRPRGDGEATLIVTRAAGRATVLVTTPRLAGGSVG